VTRRVVVPITGDDVELLPDPCRTCLFWEQGAPCPPPRSGDAVPSLLTRPRARLGGAADPAADAAPLADGDPATTAEAGADGQDGHDGGRRSTARDEQLTRKQAWVSARVQEGVPPGRVVLVGDALVAWALFAPADRFARRSPLVPPLDAGSLELATVWVHPLHRGHGLGRVLVQAAIKEAIRLELPSVQAYADRRWRDRTCVLPATWLLHEGFEVHHEHPRTPVVRLDTKRTVRWVASLEHAWEEVLERLPHRVPVPASDGLSAGVPVRSDTDPPGTVR
jgi:GNAT superfamily N-acetyltransferase